MTERLWRLATRDGAESPTFEGTSDHAAATLRLADKAAVIDAPHTLVEVGRWLARCPECSADLEQLAGCWWHVDGLGLDHTPVIAPAHLWLREGVELGAGEPKL